MKRDVELIRQTFPAGTRVKLVYMDDKWAPAPGTLGTVTFVDDIGNIHMKWDNGSTLSIIYGLDKIELI